MTRVVPPPRLPDVAPRPSEPVGYGPLAHTRGLGGHPHGMSHHRVRVVVGEGQSMRKGLLRFVLEGEGFEVVAEAATSAELAKVLAEHQPDAVVLDDGIGVTAVQMTREIAPRTKIVLVWPGAVVPIGGDARVEPSNVLKNLGGAVAKVTGKLPSMTGSFDRPEWIAKVRKDPSTLREMLAKRGGLANKRPVVTEHTW